MLERGMEESPESVQTPLLENMVVPPVFKGLTRELNSLVEQPLLDSTAEFPIRE